MAGSVEFLKKVTTSTMGLDVRTLEKVAEDNKPSQVSVLRVWGIISARKSEMSHLGPYTRYTGEIAALNILTGVEARSQELLVPAIAEGVLNKMFEGASTENATAQFALEITVTYNAPKTANSNFTKFTYGVKPLMEFSGEDALSKMAKALPAPKLLVEKKK